MTTITVTISPGELIDKITILQIKQEKITDTAKLNHVNTELGFLLQAKKRDIDDGEQLEVLTQQLKAINLKLWQIEDDIRHCEQQKDFGSVFIELARSVYLTNDQRAVIKLQINQLTNAAFAEVKDYQEYN